MPKARYITDDGQVIPLAKANLRAFYVDDGNEVELSPSNYNKQYRCYLHMGPQGVATIPEGDVVLKTMHQGKMIRVRKLSAGFSNKRHLRQLMNLKGKGERLPKSPSDDNADAWRKVVEALKELDSSQLGKMAQNAYDKLLEEMDAGYTVYEQRKSYGMPYEGLY